MFFLLHSQLEKQVHEDEEFARTLAMLDEEPKAKKVKAASVKKVCAIKFSSLFQVLFLLSSQPSRLAKALMKNKS